MINVTQPFLPPIEEYNSYIKGIWERNWLTNHGPLVIELEAQLKSFLNVRYLNFTTNGTIPLQIALKLVGGGGEVITTPFSYVATTGAIIWENCTPVFADIEVETFCIDADKIEALITDKTTAILATHVYGFPCNVAKINELAQKYKLKIIYDGAHAFGVRIQGKSIFDFGDISTCSFHATKLFHTVEGGAIICNDSELDEKISYYKAFGHKGDNYQTIGINGKNSEFHAAMGLCNLHRVPDFIKQRKQNFDFYSESLANLPLLIPEIPKDIEYNYSYFPILFQSENELLKVKAILEQKQINTRRYFYPSLNKLPYLTKTNSCPNSEDISSRVLCLPFFQQLTKEQITSICLLIKSAMSV